MIGSLDAYQLLEKGWNFNETGLVAVNGFPVLGKGNSRVLIDDETGRVVGRFNIISRPEALEKRDADLSTVEILTNYVEEMLQRPQE